MIVDRRWRVSVGGPIMKRKVVVGVGLVLVVVLFAWGLSSPRLVVADEDLGGGDWWLVPAEVVAIEHTEPGSYTHDCTITGWNEVTCAGNESLEWAYTVYTDYQLEVQPDGVEGVVIDTVFTGYCGGDHYKYHRSESGYFENMVGSRLFWQETPWDAYKNGRSLYSLDWSIPAGILTAIGADFHQNYLSSGNVFYEAVSVGVNGYEYREWEWVTTFQWLLEPGYYGTPTPTETSTSVPPTSTPTPIGTPVSVIEMPGVVISGDVSIDWSGVPSSGLPVDIVSSVPLSVNVGNFGDIEWPTPIPTATFTPTPTPIEWEPGDISGTPVAMSTPSEDMFREELGGAGYWGAAGLIEVEREVYDLGCLDVDWPWAGFDGHVCFEYVYISSIEMLGVVVPLAGVAALLVVVTVILVIKNR